MATLLVYTVSSLESMTDKQNTEQLFLSRRRAKSDIHRARYGMTVPFLRHSNFFESDCSMALWNAENFWEMHPRNKTPKTSEYWS